MSWLFSQALVVEYSQGNRSDGAQCAQLNMTATLQAYLWQDKMTDAWSRFPSGMMLEPLTAEHGKELLTLFLAGFPVKTSVQLAR